MKELVKVEGNMFNEYFEGSNGSRSVTCILDDNCVRYMVFEDGKRKSRREFSNANKELCFKNATKALNYIK